MIARRLALGARCAASRFARRALRARSRALMPSWPPLALRWKRAGRAPTAKPQVAGGPAIAAAYHCHVHRHFTVLSGTGPERAHVAPTAVTSAPHRIERSVLEWRRVVVQDSEPVGREVKPASTGNRFDDERGVQALPSPAKPAAMVIAERPSAATRFVTPPTRTFRAIAWPTSGAGARTTVAQESIPASTWSRTRRFAHEPLVLHAHGQRPIAPRARDDAAAMRVAWLVYAPELVWRAPRAKRPQASAGTTRVAVRGMAAESSPPGALTVAKAPPVASSALSGPAPVHVASLDPALVDRLADDVIRRVERRVRIERERRGL